MSDAVLEPGALLLVPRPREVVWARGASASAGAPEREWVEIEPALVGELEAARRSVWNGEKGFAGGHVRLAGFGGRSGAGGALQRNDEAYELIVETTGDGSVVVTIAGERAGWRHGLSTLGQLLRQGRGRLPRVMIRDEPGFRVRGVMLDVSRSRVPTMDELERIVDELASLKFNHLELYTEHTFAYREHAEVWKRAAPLTRDEMRRLDALCASRGIELGANQNCFGHLREWLRHREYADLAEIEAEGVWRFMQWERRGPFSLNPTDPRSLALVGGLLEELTACVTSRRVNIGCDETFDVGFGKSKSWVEARAAELLAAGADGLTFEAALEQARSALYFEFVGRVCAAAQRLGRDPMMWADIALKHPEMLHLLPSGVTGLIWGYEPETDFAAGARAWARGGRGPAWVCPGTSCWRSIVGRTREARANIARGAAEGHQAGCEGFMVCAWGDVGHMQAWPITARRLADAAEAAWNPPSPPSLSTSPTPSPTARGPLVGETMLADPHAVSLHVFGDETLTVGAWLDELGDVDEQLRRTAHANYSPDPGSRGIKNAGALFTDLFPPVPVPGAEQGRRAVEASAEQWRAVRERLAELGKRRPRLKDERLDAELAHTVRFAAFAAEHAMAQRWDASSRGAALPRLAAEAEAVLAEHRRLWRIRSRVTGEEGGGLGESCSHLRRVIETLRAQGGRGA